MLGHEARQAVTGLAGAVLSVRPLVDVLPAPVRVAGGAGMQPLVDLVTNRLGAPPLALCGSDGSGIGIFERLVSDRLDLCGRVGRLPPAAEATGADVAAAVDEAVATDPVSGWRAATVSASDGVRVQAYATGDPQAPPVVLVPACGMPARLAERWMHRLAAAHQVVTWESRGLFGELAGSEPDTGVDAQVADLIAVMDHFRLRSAHVVALCGGAVLAVVAAARNPDRVRSLSLWHGDFELGGETPKTGHQRNLQALMALAARDAAGASSVHTVLCQSQLSSVPPELAHLVLYPYTTPQLLLRYCRLNGAIMELDLRPHLPAVRQPTLVVTSGDDRTAHPEGSRYVAAALPAARLVVGDHGDHLSLFQAGSQVLDLATRFVAGEPVEGGCDAERGAE